MLCYKSLILVTVLFFITRGCYTMNAPHSKDIVVCLFLRCVEHLVGKYNAFRQNKSQKTEQHNTTVQRGDPKERKQSLGNRTPPISNKTKVNNNSLIGKLQKQLHSDAKKNNICNTYNFSIVTLQRKKTRKKEKKLNKLFQSKRDRKQRNDSQKSQRIVLRKSLPFGHVLPERKEM